MSVAGRGCGAIRVVLLGAAGARCPRPLPSAGTGNAAGRALSGPGGADGGRGAATSRPVRSDLCPAPGRLCGLCRLCWLCSLCSLLPFRLLFVLLLFHLLCLFGVGFFLFFCPSPIAVLKEILTKQSGSWWCRL